MQFSIFRHAVKLSPLSWYFDDLEYFFHTLYIRIDVSFRTAFDDFIGISREKRVTSGLCGYSPPHSYEYRTTRHASPGFICTYSFRDRRIKDNSSFASGALAVCIPVIIR